MLQTTQNVRPSLIKNARFNLLLLIYILMNIIKNYYPFMVKLDRCVGSCNTLNDLSIKSMCFK